MARVRFGTNTYHLPGSRVVRIALGVFLIFFGLLGFLPLLGFWMVPLGLIVLSADVPFVRRLNRRVTVAVSRWWTGRKSRRAQRAAAVAQPVLAQETQKPGGYPSSQGPADERIAAGNCRGVPPAG